MKKVLVIPIDDRPVQRESLVLAGKAAGIEVVLPETDITGTRLDRTTQLGGWGWAANPTTITNWLINEIKTNGYQYDGYIIALDMIHSGGLVGSRQLESPVATTATAKSLINNLFATIRDYVPASKPVFMFDSIMRLAPTNGFRGINHLQYSQFHNWAGVPRLSSTDPATIKATYAKNSANVTIPVGSGTSYPNLNTTLVNQMVAARSRKFDLNLHIIESHRTATGRKPFDFIAIGVDDAKTQGVQVNEVNYIKARLRWGIQQDVPGVPWSDVKEGFSVTSDIDSLAHVLLSRMAKQLYHPSTLLKVKISYFGTTNINTAVKQYDHEPMILTLQKHLYMAGAKVVTDSSYDVELVVVDENTSSAENLKARNRIATNYSAGKGTIYLDGKHGTTSISNVGQINTSNNFPKLLAYSRWNTFGNRAGLSARGLARFSYLKYNSDATSVQRQMAGHHVTALYREVVKDALYRTVHIGALNDYIDGVFSVKTPVSGLLPNQNWARFATVQSELNNATTMVSNKFLELSNSYRVNNLNPAFTGKATPINLSGTTFVNGTVGSSITSMTLTFPWYRNFEASITGGVLTVS